MWVLLAESKVSKYFVAGAAAGVVALMNISEGIWGGMEMYEILLGVVKGNCFGVVLLSRYVVEVLMHMWEQRRFREKKVILEGVQKFRWIIWKWFQPRWRLSDTFRKISKEKKKRME